MDKQKQIEEMHQILLSASYDWWKTAPNGKTKSEYEAECVYNAGYRKESETAEKFAERLKEKFAYDVERCKAVDEIAKEFTGDKS